MPLATGTTVSAEGEAFQSQSGKSQQCASPQACKTSTNLNPDGFGIRASFGVGMKSAKQLDGLVFDVRGAGQKVGYIVIRAECADGTDGQTGKATLAFFGVERRRLADGDRVHWADTETRPALRKLILRVQAAFRIQKDLRTVNRSEPFGGIEQTHSETSFGILISSISAAASSEP
jgi:hypothetical protein